MMERQMVNKHNEMTICIAGKNDIAVDVMLYCKKKYPNNKIVCIPNSNEKCVNTWQKSVIWFAKKNNIEIVNLDDVYKWKRLLFLSCEFNQIIDPVKFTTKRLYNVHFSLLPKYKGCHTSILPILLGDAYTGVSLHRIAIGIDTGEIVDQQKVKIDDFDNSFDLYKKLIKSGTFIIKKNIEKLMNGNFDLKRQAAVHSEYYPRKYIDYSNLSLDVHRTAYQIYNQIRAFAFRPYQYIQWNGYTCVDAKILDIVSTRKPGTIIEDNEVFVQIATIDYDLIIYKDTFKKAIELISKGKDARKLCLSKKIVESQDEHGWSLLTIAVYNNNLQMTKWLIENGSDIRVVNNNGTNLLMYAKDNFRKTGDATIFSLLHKLGLSPYTKDYYGLNLLDYCNQEGINSIGDYQFK